MEETENRYWQSQQGGDHDQHKDSRALPRANGDPFSEEGRNFKPVDEPDYSDSEDENCT